MNDLIGQHFGQYKILAPIGEGGMGVVYRALDVELKREVAVKVLPLDLARDREFVARFMREAETAAGLDHPNIVTIYNVGHQDGIYYLAMQLLSGQALNQMLRQGEPLSPSRVVHIIKQLASAVDYAHERDIIHRDIKPANIMVGADDYVTLMDFGIAKALSRSKITRTGTMIGTPEYMAPEQFTGEPVDARSDVYALSIVLYEMLTGCVPFTGETPVAISHGHVYQQPTPLRHQNPHISPAVERVVLRGLAKRPEARYASAGALAQALQAALEGRESSETEHLRRSLKLVLPEGREHALAPGILRLGRSSENDVGLADAKISRHHAEIRSDAHGSAIMDLDSANGTFV
ncbi:MAG: protein kinase, partial [Chloroflexi bacterium]|nr:protein kinase [Chloroflexota bacterium]